jgi:hypothetical protein
MHALLSELATLEAELKDLERSLKAIGDIPRPSSAPPPRAEAPRPPPRSSIDDELERLKRAGPTTGTKSAPRPQPGVKPKQAGGGGIDDELAALKKKMQQQPPKKKP